MLTKNRGREDGEEDVSRYLMSLGKGEYSGNWKSTHSIVLSGELALEGAVDLTWERLRNVVDWRWCSTAW